MKLSGPIQKAIPSEGRLTGPEQFHKLVFSALRALYKLLGINKNIFLAKSLRYAM